MARPTQSAPLYQQMLGRGTRTYPGTTDCLVLDVVGVSTHHTLHTAATLFDCDAGRLARQSVLELLERPAHQDQEDAALTGTLRSTPVDLLRQHPAGLSAEEIRVYLRPDKPLGDVLQGMRRQSVVNTRGRGKETRYYIP